MANFVYNSVPTVGKIKVTVNGAEVTKYVRDIDVRALLETFNKDIVLGNIGGMSEENKFVYSQNIKKYVDDLVAVGLVIEVVDSLPEASQDTMGKIYLVPHSHDEESKDIKDEYITYKTGTDESPVYTWEKIGNTDIDLSKYVTDVSYADGKLSQTKDGVASVVHEFGAFADANTGEGKVSTADSASFAYTPAGDVTVTLKDESASVASSGSFTPAGSISGDAIKGGSVEVTLQDSTSKSAAEVSFDSYKPEGTVAAPTITVAPETKSVQFVDEVGTLPSFTEGAFTAAEIKDGFYTEGTLPSFSHEGFSGGSLGAATKDKFVKKVQSIGVDPEDEDCLVISDIANTDTTWYGEAVKEQGTYTAAVEGTFNFDAGSVSKVDVTKFSGGSKAKDTFGAGSLPTLKAAEDIMIGATASASAPVFTGTSADIKVASVKYVKPEVKSAEFTPEAATLSFAGTAGAVNVTGNYMKQAVESAEFVGTAAAGTEVSLNKTEKTVTVNPK